MYSVWTHILQDLFNNEKEMI